MSVGPPGRCCFEGQCLRSLTLHGAVQQTHRGAAVSQEVQGAGDAHPWDGAPQKHPHSLSQTRGIRGCTRGCTHSYFCRNRGEKMNGIPHSLQSCLPCNRTWESDSTHHLLSQWAAGISSYLLITVSSEHFPFLPEYFHRQLLFLCIPQTGQLSKNLHFLPGIAVLLSPC